jgi:aryl-alcohol dehydrogenase-like predicted oxidoreductase
MLDYCRKEGIAILTWSPLEQGVLTGKFPPGAKVRGWRRVNRFFHQSNLRRSEALLDALRVASEAHGHTTSQGALAWLLRHDNVIAIPGASKPEQVLSNAGGSGWSFEERELEDLDGAYARFVA